MCDKLYVLRNRLTYKMNYVIFIIILENCLDNINVVLMRLTLYVYLNNLLLFGTKDAYGFVGT